MGMGSRLVFERACLEEKDYTCPGERKDVGWELGHSEQTLCSESRETVILGITVFSLF